MAMVNVCSLIFVLLISMNDAIGHPTAQSDLISGQDFLSLFSDSKTLRALTESRNRAEYLKQLEEDDTILPIEKLFLSNDEMMAESSNHFSFEKRTNRKLDTFTATATLKNPTPEATDANKSQLQLVKTGSKIIFIEQSSEDTKDAEIPSTQTSNVELDDGKKVRVIGVSVSSSVAQRSSTPQRDFPVDVTPSRRSGSDFSIEEDEPLTTLNKEISDSAKEESMNVHSFVAPPDSGVSQLPVAQQQSQQVRSRTQRKQDDVVPYQAIIYHDNDEKKERTPLPRSISYTSVGQTVSEPKLWRDFDAHRPNKTAGLYSLPEKIYGEPSKIYSVPAKIYGQPSKVYSEPAKIYSEPAKIYSEPAKVYSEPAKVYGKPAKVYAEPPTTFPAPTTQSPALTSVPPSRKIVFNLDKLPYDLLNRPQSTRPTHPHFRGHNFTPSSTPDTLAGSTVSAFDGPTPEQNYEVDEAVSVMTNGRHHGIQSPSVATPISDDDAKKVGYVVEGRNFRKYRVEEKTADGFIVGEYGVVSHDDGSLRGVRYTADSNISPSLIYNALLKFLSL